MNSAVTTFRFFITASLLFSLTTSGLLPRVVVGQALGSTSTESAGTGEQHCCCGTQDGRCCGMACCQTSPNPNERHVPAAPQASEDRSQPLGLAPMAIAAALGPKTATFFRGFVRNAASTGGSSLIALSIRLNV